MIIIITYHVVRTETYIILCHLYALCEEKLKLYIPKYDIRTLRILNKTIFCCFF